LNGGPPIQGFTGSGDDSLIANHQYNPLHNCPDVRCIQADAPTDSMGVTYLTWLGATPGSPGVATRDPNRKWGEYAGDLPLSALGVQLQGRLTTNSPNGSYTAHVKNFDCTGGRVTALDFGERVTTTDNNVVTQGLNVYNYAVDFDNSGAVTFTDVSLFTPHYNPTHYCDYPNNP
jgi:hypothetical protein